MQLNVLSSVYMFFPIAICKWRDAPPLPAPHPGKLVVVLPALRHWLAHLVNRCCGVPGLRPRGFAAIAALVPPFDPLNQGQLL